VSEITFGLRDAKASQSGWPFGKARNGGELMGVFRTIRKVKEAKEAITVVNNIRKAGFAQGVDLMMIDALKKSGKKLSQLQADMNEGDLCAQYYVALSYYYGKGTSTDNDKAIHLCQDLIKQVDAGKGGLYAKVYVGSLLYHGRMDTPVDKEQALRFWREVLDGRETYEDETWKRIRSRLAVVGADEGGFDFTAKQLANHELEMHELTQTKHEGVKKKKGCYVATCIYGSYDCSEVWVLRRFRDNTLANMRIGRLFISVYYWIGPKITNTFGKSKCFNFLSKFVINRLVLLLQNKGVDNSPYKDS